VQNPVIVKINAMHIFAKYCKDLMPFVEHFKALYWSKVSVLAVTTSFHDL